MLKHLSLSKILSLSSIDSTLIIFDAGRVSSHTFHHLLVAISYAVSGFHWSPNSKSFSKLSLASASLHISVNKLIPLLVLS